MISKKIIKPLKRNKNYKSLIIQNKAKNNLRLETLDAGNWIQSSRLNSPSRLKIPTREFLSKFAQIIQAIGYPKI